MRKKRFITFLLALIIVFQCMLPAAAETETAAGTAAGAGAGPGNGKKPLTFQIGTLSVLPSHFPRQRDFEVLLHHIDDEEYCILMSPDDIALLTETQVFETENGFSFERGNYSVQVDTELKSADICLDCNGEKYILYIEAFPLDEMMRYKEGNAPGKMYLPLEKMLYLLNTRFKCMEDCVVMDTPKDTVWNLIGDFDKMTACLPNYTNLALGDDGWEIIKNSAAYCIMSFGDEIDHRLFFPTKFTKKKLDESLADLAIPASASLGEKTQAKFLEKKKQSEDSIKDIIDFAKNVSSLVSPLAEDGPYIDSNIFEEFVNEMENPQPVDSSEWLKKVGLGSLLKYAEGSDYTSSQIEGFMAGPSREADEFCALVQQDAGKRMLAVVDNVLPEMKNTEIPKEIKNIPNYPDKALKITGFLINAMLAIKHAGRSEQWGPDFVTELNYFAHLDENITYPDRDARKLLKLVSKVAGKMEKEVGHEYLNKAKGIWSAVWQEICDDFCDGILPEAAIYKAIMNCTTTLSKQIPLIGDSFAAGDRMYMARQQLDMMYFALKGYDDAAFSVLTGGVNEEALKNFFAAGKSAANSAAHVWSNLCKFGESGLHTSISGYEDLCVYMDTYLARLADAEREQAALYLYPDYNNLYCKEHGAVREKIPEEYVKFPSPGIIVQSNYEYSKVYVDNGRAHGDVNLVMTRPTVTIPGNEEAAEKINNDEMLRQWIISCEDRQEDSKNGIISWGGLGTSDCWDTCTVSDVFASEGAVSLHLQQSYHFYNNWQGSNNEFLSYSLATGNLLTIADILDKDYPDAYDKLRYELTKRAENEFPTQSRPHMSHSVEEVVGAYLDGGYGGKWYASATSFHAVIPYSAFIDDDFWLTVMSNDYLYVSIPYELLENVIAPEFIPIHGEINNDIEKIEILRADEAPVNAIGKAGPACVMLDRELKNIGLHSEFLGLISYTTTGGTGLWIPDFEDSYTLSCCGEWFVIDNDGGQAEITRVDWPRR